MLTYFFKRSRLFDFCVTSVGHTGVEFPILKLIYCMATVELWNSAFEQQKLDVENVEFCKKALYWNNLWSSKQTPKKSSKVINIDT